MIPSACQECQGVIEYVPEALSHMCLSCGIMLDPNQFVLVTPDVSYAEGWSVRLDAIPDAHHTYGNGDKDSLGRERRWKSNAVSVLGFVQMSQAVDHPSPSAVCSLKLSISSDQSFGRWTTPRWPIAPLDCSVPAWRRRGSNGVGCQYVSPARAFSLPCGKVAKGKR